MEGNEPIVDSNIIEVDEITEAVDLDNAIQDDNGRVIQYVNEEGKTVKLKGAVNPFEAPKPEKAAKTEKTKGAPGGDEGAAGDEGEENEDEGDEEGDESGEEGDKEDEVEYSNPAEYILRKSGYTKDEIDLGDGNVVKIKDLTPEQQLLVMKEEFDATVAEYQEALEEEKGKTPELKFDDPQHQQFLEYLKEGGDIKKLAKEILSRDPAAQAKMLSDDEIVKMGLKKEFPEMSDEDIDAEFNDIKSKEGAVARRAKALRARMEKAQPDFSDLTEQEKQARKAEYEAQVQEFTAQADGVKKAAKELKEIAGIKLSDPIRNYLVNRVIPSKMEDDSEFIKGLEDPNTLLELEFYRTYGKKLAEYHYNRGKAEVEAARKASGTDTSDLSDEPIRTYKGRGTGKAKTAKKSIDDFGSFEDWLNAENKF